MSTAVRLLALTVLLTGCGASSDFQVSPTQTGTVAGTVSSSLGGALAGVSLVVTPAGGTALPAVTTSSSGGYRVLNVPILSGGRGSIAVNGVPSNCTAPSALSFSGLPAHDSLAVPITVPCTVVGGSLLVTINATAGIADTVTVTGPGAFSRTLTASTTLTGLAAGSYVISARNGHASGAIVDAADSATIIGSPAAVVNGTTDTTTVTYAPRPGIGLWAANNGGASAFEEFTGAQLAAGGSPTPTAVINAATPSAAIAIAFDHAGNLWASDGGARVVEFSAGQLGSGGTITPATAITTAGAALEGLAFDNSGDLWAADNNHGVVEFSTSQVASGGSLIPAISVNTAAGSAADMAWTIAFNPHTSATPLYNRVVAARR